MVWQKDEGDVQSSQVSAKANQISDKNSYCCNINPNFHQMQPWDIMWILLLWSITRSFCSHQQLVSGGASEERSICLLLNLAMFLGLIFWFLSFLHSLNTAMVPRFYFCDLGFRCFIRQIDQIHDTICVRSSCLVQFWSGLCQKQPSCAFSP